MSNARKLQTEIDRVMKKVDEGVELFDEIWEKVYSAEQQNQKEKYEMDLKKEIKKLQRLRDQIKTWIGSSDVKDKDALVEARKLIETKMEQFKICEKETKTKTYSKEGLAREERLDPAEEAKLNTTTWLQEYIEQFTSLVEEKDFEIEKLSSGKGKKTNKHQIEEMQDFIGSFKFHINKLEGIIRLVNNDVLDVEPVEQIKDDLDYFFESYSDEDYMMAYDEEFFYEALGLEELDVVNVDRVTQPPPAKKPDDATSTSSKSSKDKGGRSKKSALSSVIPLTIGRARTKGDKAKEKEEQEAAAAATAAAAAAASTPVKAPRSTSTTSSNGSNGSSVPAAPPAARPAAPSPPAQGASMAAILKRESEQQEKEKKLREQQARAAQAEQVRLQQQRQQQAQQQQQQLRQQEALRLQQQQQAQQQQQEAAKRQQQEVLRQQQEAAAQKQAAQLQAQQQASADQKAQTLQNQPLQSQTSQNNALDLLTSGLGGLGLGSNDKRMDAPSGLGAPGANQNSASSEGSAGYISALNESFMTAPNPTDNERPRQYTPQNPYPTPAAYPTQPSAIFENPAVFEKLGTDCLFFIFYYAQGTYQQYLAARELKKQSWRFHKKYMTWFQRHEEPKITTDEYEQGTYVYFDYETGWCTRIKTDFRFEYSFLEDSLQ